jgi:hypothetical protein
MPRPAHPSRFDAARAQRILREAVAAPDPDLGRAVQDALLALDGYSDGEIAEMHKKAGRD